jgi:hypothetical protein
MRSFSLRPMQFRYERRCVRFAESNELWRREDETRCQLRVAEVADVNHMGHTRAHDRITFVSHVSLTGIVGEKNPIAMLADFRKEVRVLGIFPEMLHMSLDAIPRVLERVGHAPAQVAVRKKRELMLRIRKRALR